MFLTGVAIRSRKRGTFLRPSGRGLREPIIGHRQIPLVSRGCGGRAGRFRLDGLRPAEVLLGEILRSIDVHDPVEFCALALPADQVALNLDRSYGNCTCLFVGRTAAAVV